MPAFANLIDDLTQIFAEIDADYEVRQQGWASSRAKVLREFKASEEYKSMRRDQSKLYARMFAICGGKAWFQVLNGSDASIRDFVTRNCAATVEKRNTLIAKKLSECGIVEVTGKETEWNKGGFDGLFYVNTDKGSRTVKINTIIAGGYNVQCLHQRTLVKVLK